MIPRFDHGPARRCATTKWFSRCPGEPVGSCQYCGRTFCADHGEIVGDNEQVCYRRLCQQKHADVGRHREYREAVRQRNAWNRCGVGGCQNPQWGTCSRCQGVFCAEHLSERGVGSTERLYISVCEHCWNRRKLWGSD